MTQREFLLPSLPGTYAIVFRCESSFEAVVGRLGTQVLDKGYWVYVGSAFGPGGLRSRLKHHLQPSTRHHWHLDYVKKGMRAIEIWYTTDPCKREHRWAKALAEVKGASCPIQNFGATDCNCRAHLIHFSRKTGINRFKTNIHPFFEKTNPFRKTEVSSGDRKRH